MICKNFFLVKVYATSEPLHAPSGGVDVTNDGSWLGGSVGFLPRDFMTFFSEPREKENIRGKG